MVMVWHSVNSGRITYPQDNSQPNRAAGQRSHKRPVPQLRLHRLSRADDSRVALGPPVSAASLGVAYPSASLSPAITPV